MLEEVGVGQMAVAALVVLVVAAQVQVVLELRVKQTLAEAVGVVGSTELPPQRRVALVL